VLLEQAELALAVAEGDEVLAEEADPDLSARFRQLAR
jgi:hypothetical protein